MMFMLNKWKSYMEYVDESAKTIETYEYWVNKFFAETKLNPSEVKKADINLYLMSKKDSLSANTINLIVRALTSFYKVTIEELGLLNMINPCVGIKTPKIKDVKHHEAISKEEVEKLTREQEEEIKSLDEEDDSIYNITGKVYPEPTLKDFDKNSPALYTAKLRGKYSIWAEMNTDKGTKRIKASTGSTQTVDILYVGLQWLIARNQKSRKIGYIKREWLTKIDDVIPADPVNMPPMLLRSNIPW